MLTGTSCATKKVICSEGDLEDLGEVEGETLSGSPDKNATLSASGSNPLLLSALDVSHVYFAAPQPLQLKKMRHLNAISPKNHPQFGEACQHDQTQKAFLDHDVINATSSVEAQSLSSKGGLLNQFSAAENSHPLKQKRIPCIVVSIAGVSRLCTINGTPSTSITTPDIPDELSWTPSLDAERDHVIKGDSCTDSRVRVTTMVRLSFEDLFGKNNNKHVFGSGRSPSNA